MSIAIDSSTSRVWRIIEKHLEHPEVSPMEHEPGAIQESHAESLSEKRSGVGTRTRWSYSYMGRPFAWEDIVTLWEPGKKIAWKATSAWNMNDSFTLRQEGNRTLLIYDMDYHLPYGPLGWIYGKLILEPRMKKLLNRVLRRTKKLCETPFQ